MRISFLAKAVCGVVAVVVLVLPQARAGGSLPFEEVSQSLAGSSFAQALGHLEFYPTATGETIGKQYEGLSGSRIGPYECRARVMGVDTKPGVYPLVVTITTKPTYYNEDGTEVPLEKDATSKSEVATEVTIKLLPEDGEEANIGDKDSKPVSLRDLVGGYEQQVVENECFFINGKALRIGMKDKEVEALLKPAKITKGQPNFVEATGDTEVRWEIPELDLEIAFVISEDKKSTTVSSLSAGQKAKVETSRGVKIGTAESRVKIAYADVINKQDSTDGEMQIMGNVYYGVFMEISEGKVASIYVGQGAE